MDKLFPELEVNVSTAEGRRALISRIGQQETWIEIGFGGGEHLKAQSQAHPDIQFVGCEPFRNGVAKLVSDIASNDINNIQIHADDARLLLTYTPTASIGRIYLLFPDPWPKRRQRKRRFISDDQLAELARVMCDGAELRFATDIDDYAGWALSHILRCDFFHWRASCSSDWASPWPDHCATRYERKAFAAGRRPVYLTFVRAGRSV